MEWFSDPGNSAFAAFAVSVIALGVSVWAIIESRRASRRSSKVTIQKPFLRLAMQELFEENY